MLNCSEFDAQVLMDLLKSSNAWRLLHDPEVQGKLGMDGLLELMLAAGYPEEVAQKAASRRGLDRLCSGQTP